ncbi:MAG: GerAB/ArcD/ProY family transporter [Clostridiales bacterium]|nr:GerAB/ArcD/ProY family transporter [Clostridiales bacterium]
METKAKITPFQFYSMLYLCRIFSLAAFMSFEGEGSADLVPRGIVSGIYLIITSIPTILLIKKDNQSSVLTRASRISPLFGKIVCVIYLFDFLVYGIITAGRFNFLVSAVMPTQSNMVVAVLLLIAASAYCAYRGIEGLGRASVLFLIPVLLSFAFVFISLFKRFDALNFEPFQWSNASGAVKGGIYFTSVTGEILAVAVSVPFVKKQKSRHIIILTVLSAVAVIATLAMLTGVLGNFSLTRLFGVYTLSSVAEWGLAERADAVIICIWMVCAVIKLSFLLFLWDYTLSCLVGKVKTALYLTLGAFAAAAGTLTLSSEITVFKGFLLSPVVYAIYIVTAVVLPASVLAGEKISKKTQKRKWAS